MEVSLLVWVFEFGVFWAGGFCCASCFGCIYCLLNLVWLGCVILVF